MGDAGGTRLLPDVSAEMTFVSPGGLLCCLFGKGMPLKQGLRGHVLSSVCSGSCWLLLLSFYLYVFLFVCVFLLSFGCVLFVFASNIELLLWFHAKLAGEWI